MGERIKKNTKKPLSTKENSASNKQKTDFRSQSSHVNQILFLQKTIGNQAMQRLIKSWALQAKLRIGQPGDKYEQEADRVADEVMWMPEMQRQVDEEEEEELLQTKPLVDQITPLVQRQVEEEEEEEEMLQAKSREDATPEVSYGLESQINAIKGGGRPLAESERSYFEPRFGTDFSQVRVHTDSQAAETAHVLNARAFTTGRDIVFGAGQYAPEATGGKKLLAHELTHMMQQTGVFGNSLEPVTSGEIESSFGRNPWISSDAPRAIQRKPRQVTAHRFLGLNIGGGINPTLALRLDAVAAQLRLGYQTVHGTRATNDTFVRNWAGIHSMRGWRQRNRPSTSKHCSGSAVDVNYNNQPYIVTRSIVNGRVVLGGERAGRRLTAQRQATVDVFDRAKEFVFGRIKFVVPYLSFTIDLPNMADVSERRRGESTGDVFDRFKETSNALATYLGLAFDTTPDTVLRQPINNIETVREAVLLRNIPTTERKTEAAGIAAIQAYIRAHLTTAGTGPTFHFSTNDVALARSFYFRMLRDYEHVRIPMVRGNPVARPGNTRNPARGFLDMSREFVVAMADIGRLRWGISDLGSAESGDTHHFDLGNHGGVAPDCLP